MATHQQHRGERDHSKLSSAMEFSSSSEVSLYFCAFFGPFVLRLDKDIPFSFQPSGTNSEKEEPKRRAKISHLENAYEKFLLSVC